MRILGAFTVLSLLVAGLFLATVLVSVLVQLQPGHGDPLCGRDCYPVEVQR